MAHEPARGHVDVERDGTGPGTILGLALAVAVVLAIVWFLFLGGMGNAAQPRRGSDSLPQQQQLVQPPKVNAN